MSALMDGRWDEVEPAIGRLLAHASHEPNMQNLAAGQLFCLRREQGRLAELRPVLEQHAAQEAAIPAFSAALAVACVAEGLLDDAGAVLSVLVDGSDVLAPRDLTWTTTLALLAEVAVAVGDTRRAEVIQQALAPYRAHALVACKGIGCLGAVDRYLAMLAAVVGDEEGAARDFEAALGLERRLGAPALLVRTEVVAGHWMLADKSDTRRRDRGRQMLSSAAGTARRLGMPALAHAAERPAGGGSPGTFIAVAT